MKITKTIAVLFLMLFSCETFAALSPSGPSSVTIDIQGGKAGLLEKNPGKKLTLLQKIQLKILQKKLRKFGEGELTEKQAKQAKWSMILGISSLVLLFIPYVGILALPAAIAAIIMGALSLKGNSNTKGIVGVVTGGVTLLLFLLAVIVLVALIGSL